ncbi:MULTISPECIES: 2-oxoadipate dioxygenase/decarboxylase HglS [unclassified Janthinobacterium]|uniref:2-oxoadipate dioxygenase/decarboxylase HglS n=1 Tax=unclassified Janthinobacterium TaxID=2610881 RepID=UPI00047769A2|nr:MULTISPECIES: VOC family protein [unclassified Janthinobacterium]
MHTPPFVSTDEIRSRFSKAMSDMYRQEVPQYGTLLELVTDVNAAVMQGNPGLAGQLAQSGELERLDVERHGAIRLGTPAELANMRRIFGVMGMLPVGYYDLSVAGVPVHSTAFRPISDAALTRNPFRVFTSLLRLELIDNAAVRAEIEAILSRRNIFTERALELTRQFEATGGLLSSEADEFVAEVRETFRWHSEATVGEDTYHRLHQAHRLIADVACFKGPHINHLTPRTLDIDAAQAEMLKRGVGAKDVIEGPPTRKCPILLRQTSFKALEERVAFVGADSSAQGTHTARFGEIEQRGMALTGKGRALYDELLAGVRNADQAGSAGGDYAQRLAAAFLAFPDEPEAIRRAGLAFFSYALTDAGSAAIGSGKDAAALDELVAGGYVQARPITYEDFLPVSAAGIFQSNLGGAEQKSYAANEAKTAFEAALGASVYDEIALYQALQSQSIEAVRSQLRGDANHA